MSRPVSPQIPTPGELGLQTIAEYGLSKNTTSGYSGYIKAAKVWFRANFPEFELDPLVVSSDTPNMLFEFLSFKFETEHCRYSTVEGIRSAFANYYQGLECDYWKSDEGIGNPVYSLLIKKAMGAFKSKDAKVNGSANRTLPMFYYDMRMASEFIRSNRDVNLYLGLNEARTIFFISPY